jgi:carbon-monoxide dehydrogenase large subunit
MHPEAENNLIFDWGIGDEGRDRGLRRAATSPAMDITNNRLVPNAMEPRAAFGHYDKAEEHLRSTRRRRIRTSRGW